MANPAPPAERRPTRAGGAAAFVGIPLALVALVYAPLLAADLLLRAVPVPAGNHLVALAYAPPGLAAGALIALLGLGVLVGLAVRRPSSDR